MLLPAEHGYEWLLRIFLYPYILLVDDDLLSFFSALLAVFQLSFQSRDLTLIE